MKIVRLSTFLDFGGLEKRLVNLSHVDDGNDWNFVCLNKTGFAAGEIQKLGKQVVNLNAKPTIYSFRTTWKVYQYLKKAQPDILHTSGAEANFHGIIAGKLAGVNKIIAEEIGISSQRMRGRMVFRQIYKFADAIIGNSKPVVDSLRKKVNIPNHKLHQISNPIIFNDFEHYQFQFEPAHATHLVSISRLTAVKNIGSVIKVVSRLIQENHDVYYHIYGDGEEKESLQALIDQNQVNDRIKLYGFEPDPLEKLNAADIFVLNSYTEGFSNALCEAMYTKTLVITTDSGSATEMIEHNKSGFIIPVGDEQQLYKQLIVALKVDKENKQKMVALAHDKVISSYSLESHLKELYKIYK